MQWSVWRQWFKHKSSWCEHKKLQKTFSLHLSPTLLGSAWTFKPTSPRDQQQAPIKSRVFTSSNHSQSYLNHPCSELLASTSPKSPTPPNWGPGSSFPAPSLCYYFSPTLGTQGLFLSLLLCQWLFLSLLLPPLYLPWVILNRFPISKTLHEYASKDNERRKLAECASYEGTWLYSSQKIQHLSKRDSLEKDSVNVNGLLSGYWDYLILVGKPKSNLNFSLTVGPSVLYLSIPSSQHVWSLAVLFISAPHPQPPESTWRKILFPILFLDN